MTIATSLRRGRALLLALGVVAGCGDPSPTQPVVSPAPSIASAGSACELVADMDALVGRTAVAAPSSYVVGSNERCLWVYTSDPSRYVALTVGEASSHAATIQSFGDGEIVDGVGDEARWWSANRTLSVVIGDRSLQVDLQLDDAADPEALAVSIALAASRDSPEAPCQPGDQASTAARARRTSSRARSSSHAPGRRQWDDR